MRALVLATSIAVVYAVGGCGNGMSSDDTAPADTPTSTPTSMGGMDMGTPDDAAKSTQTDVETIAVRLEQVFFSSGYPEGLAGAVKAADDEGLAPTPGNTIGGYVYDAEDLEFQLCVENEGGAYAVYDTSPMSVRSSGETGGCPGAWGTASTTKGRGPS